MPIEAPAGTLEVENAKFRASSVEATIAVGIGTESNDAYPLQIFKETAPDIRLSEGSTISSAARFYSNNSNLYIQTGTDFTSGSAGDVAFQTMGGQSTHMVIKSDGKVGVGTGAPVGKLQINVPDASASTATWDNTKVVFGNIANENSQGLGFGVSTDSHASIISLAPGVAWRGLSYYSARHKWYINNVEKMTLDASGNVGIGTTSPKTDFGTPAFEVYNGVIMSGERTTATDPNYSMYVGKGTGSGWLTGYRDDGGHVFAFYNTSPSSAEWSGALSSFYINKHTVTSRSINAGGTINASGTDYAEYIRKKDLDMVINKGDIVGIDSNAYLTNVFSESVTFVVKSTDPALIGGDTWGVDLDMYAPKKPTELNSDASEEEINSYNLELQNYETEKLIWEEQHENARKPYDRIAFCGQVPENVYNATPGQYVIPKQTDDDTISYELTNTPTFEQYQISIGKVIKIQEDGRAWIVVKIS